jgi:hypothetical protein
MLIPPVSGSLLAIYLLTLVKSNAGADVIKSLCSDLDTPPEQSLHIKIDEGIETMVLATLQRTTILPVTIR